MHGLVGFLLIASTVGQPDLTADGIARAVEQRPTGDTSRAELAMTLVNSAGEMREQILTVVGRTEHGLRKQLTRVTAPADIAGTGFLALENADRVEDQFLFLPDVGRSRRIGGNQKTGRFLGSDFTYEDLSRLRAASYTHALTGEETIDERPCWVLESVPVGASQYSRLRRWIDRERSIDLRIDYLDAKGRVVKRFLVGTLEEIDGIWTLQESSMEDYREKQTTRIVTRSVRPIRLM